MNRVDLLEASEHGRRVCWACLRSTSGGFYLSFKKREEQRRLLGEVYFIFRSCENAVGHLLWQQKMIRLGRWKQVHEFMGEPGGGSRYATCPTPIEDYAKHTLHL